MGKASGYGHGYGYDKISSRHSHGLRGLHLVSRGRSEISGEGNIERVRVAVRAAYRVLRNADLWDSKQGWGHGQLELSYSMVAGVVITGAMRSKMVRVRVRGGQRVGGNSWGWAWGSILSQG